VEFEYYKCETADDKCEGLTFIVCLPVGKSRFSQGNTTN